MKNTSMPYNTVGNYDYTKSRKEKTDKPSKTIPDQSMSVREIVSRFAKGLPISGNSQQPIWEGENPILPPNFQNLDMVEQRQIIQSLKTKVSQTQAELARKQAEAAAKKREEHIEKMVQERLKKAQEEPSN